jgi:RNA polymerase sigma factor (sigma-70 family)
MHYQELIQKIRDKDSSCLEELYNQYGKKLYAYCLQQWHLDEDRAWEAVYQTLEAMILKGGQYEFESEARFNGFLFKVLFNFIRQAHRKNKGATLDIVSIDMHTNENLSPQLQVTADEQISFDELREGQDNNRLLQKVTVALSKLNPDERDLLLLKSQNYTYDEIAAMLKIENNQLKVRHHRAKQKLLQQLKSIATHENE